MRGLTRNRRGVPADHPGQVDDGADDDACCLHDLVAGGLPGDGKAGPVRVGAGLADGGVGHRSAQHLVGHQQGVDLLGDGLRGAGAQDVAAQDGGLQTGCPTESLARQRSWSTQF